MKFGPDLLDEIRARISISSVVGGKVAWDRRKSNPGKGDYWACCPFHGEKSPSFHVDDRKGRYHCFGCKVSGDIFTFLVEKDGLSFPEAVEKLAVEAGLPIPRGGAEDAVRDERRKSLYEVIELAAVYYSRKLLEPEGSKALSYLRKRGIRDETIREFRLGFAPDSKSGLRSYLADHGIALEQMVAAGLVAAGPDIPVAYDRFRDRIMFPIQDQKGRVIAFGGRAMTDDALAKYLNSPETELFDKGSVLYNLHRARKPAFDTGKVILVEGYMDVIAVYQEGIQYVTAALGTALTENHLRQLWKLAPEPVMCFDGDKAGEMAATRALDRALPFFSAGHSLHFSFLPNGKDPADLMTEGRSQEFIVLIENAMTAVDYFWDRETTSARIDTPEQKAALESKIKLAIGQIADTTVRRFYDLRLRINLSDLFWKKDRTRIAQKVRKNVIHISGDAGLEHVLLGMAVEYPQIAMDDVQGFQSWSFKNQDFNVFHTELVRLLVDLEDCSVASIYDRLSERFFNVLDDVHGKESPDKKHSYGHALYRRMPILKHSPSDSFVIRLFELFHQKLVLNELVVDRDQALTEFEREFTHRNEQLLFARIREIERVLEQIRNAEKELEDEAALISEAARLSRSNRKPIFAQIPAYQANLPH